MKILRFLSNHKNTWWILSLYCKIRYGKDFVGLFAGIPVIKSNLYEEHRRVKRDELRYLFEKELLPAIRERIKKLSLLLWG